MNLKSFNIEELAQMHVALRHEESIAASKRRDVEDEIINIMKKRGTDALKLKNGLRIFISERDKKTVSSEKLRDIVNEEDLDQVSKELFNWVLSVNEKSWGGADARIKEKFLDAIKIERKRPTVKVTN